MTEKQYRSIKLTETMRAEIRSNVLKVFDSKNPMPSDKDEATALYDRWMWHQYGEIYGEVLKAFSKGTRAFIRVATSIKSITQLNKNTLYHLEIHPRPRTDEQEYIKITEDIEGWPQLKDLLDKRSEVGRLEKERKKILSQVTTALSSVNTTKQLIESWPEIENFVTPYLSGKSAANLPAVSTTEINKILGWEET